MSAEISLDIDGDGTFDGSFIVKGVFGRAAFDVAEDGNGGTIITLDDQGPIGGFISGLFEKFTDGWDFF